MPASAPLHSPVALGDTAPDDGSPKEFWLTIYRADGSCPDTIPFAFAEGLVEPSLPSSLASLRDALYWAENSRRAVTIQFLGLLDSGGEGRNGFSRYRPYFSLEDNQYINTESFLQTVAQFEVRPLPINDQRFSVGERDRSNQFVTNLVLFAEDLERNNNKDMMIPVTNMCKESYEQDVGSTLLFETGSIFVKPKSGCLEEKLGDLSITRNSAEPSILWLDRVDDPWRMYIDFLERHADFSCCDIVPPVILDTENKIVHPIDYKDRLVHLTPVLAKAYICLRETPMDIEKGDHGSRTYRLILKSLQIIDPTHSPM